MAASKITAKEFIRLSGNSTSRITFIVNKKYKVDDTRTSNQWEKQLIADRVIDKREKTTPKSTQTEE